MHHVRGWCELIYVFRNLCTVQVFAATAARFYWELSWQVVVEATGETYRGHIYSSLYQLTCSLNQNFPQTGDFATKMEFSFNMTTSTFSLVQIQNEVVLETQSCFRCTRIASLSWAQLQAPLCSPVCSVPIS